VEIREQCNRLPATVLNIEFNVVLEIFANPREFVFDRNGELAKVFAGPNARQQQQARRVYSTR
jgi:hypothetical protein